MFQARAGSDLLSALFLHSATRDERIDIMRCEAVAFGFGYGDVGKITTVYKLVDNGLGARQYFGNIGHGEKLCHVELAENDSGSLLVADDRQKQKDGERGSEARSPNPIHD